MSNNDNIKVLLNQLEKYQDNGKNKCFLRSKHIYKNLLCLEKNYNNKYLADSILEFTKDTSVYLKFDIIVNNEIDFIAYTSLERLIQTDIYCKSKNFYKGYNEATVLELKEYTKNEIDLNFEVFINHAIIRDNKGNIRCVSVGIQPIKLYYNVFNNGKYKDPAFLPFLMLDKTLYHKCKSFNNYICIFKAFVEINNITNMYKCDPVYITYGNDQIEKEYNKLKKQNKKNKYKKLKKRIRNGLETVIFDFVKENFSVDEIQNETNNRIKENQITCGCGSIIQKTSLTRHLVSFKHLLYLKNKKHEEDTNEGSDEEKSNEGSNSSNEDSIEDSEEDSKEDTIEDTTKDFNISFKNYVYFEDKEYIKNLLLDLYQSNRQFYEYYQNYNRLFVLKDIHMDNYLGNHINIMLKNENNNNKTPMLHCYIRNKKITTITKIENII